MNRKDLTETLRTRGIDWVDGKPLFSLQPKWLPYLTDPAWLTVERWIDLVNRLPTEETLAELSPQEAMENFGLVNFGIRSYSYVDDPGYLIPLLRDARWTLEALVTQPRPKGIEHFEPDPWVLFTMALSLVKPDHVKQCSVCRRVFFAKRKDQNACSSPCSNTARQRRFREKAYYNQNRKRNRRAREAHEQQKLREVRDKLRRGRE